MHQDVRLRDKLPHLIALVRLDRPIGIYLLLWPTLWALWFAAEGVPPLDTLLIFVLGTVLTRSAGCAINDYADRKVDGQVARTRARPLATGALTPRDALVTMVLLMSLAFVLVLFTNLETILLSFVALVLASVYPFTKRYTHWPQVVLGMAFAVAIPMAFTAVTKSVPPIALWLFAAAVLWTVAYDTLYAMADREDDLAIGVKSTAVLFGRADLIVVGALQLVVLVLLGFVGSMAGRGVVYAGGLAVAAALATWQLWHARHRHPAACIEAFLNNHWLGLAVFVGLALDYALTGASGP